MADRKEDYQRRESSTTMNPRRKRRGSNARRRGWTRRIYLGRNATSRRGLALMESFHDKRLRDKRAGIVVVVVSHSREYLNSSYKYHDNDQRAPRKSHRRTSPIKDRIYDKTYRGERNNVPR